MTTSVRRIMPAVLTATIVGALTATGGGASALPGPDSVPSGRPDPAIELRVPQAGVAVGDDLRVFVMSAHGVGRHWYRLVDAHGRQVATAVSGPSRGAWNARYGAVQAVDFGTVAEAGAYVVRPQDGSGAVSPTIPVGERTEVSRRLTTDGTAFLAEQRDGPDVVPGRLDRQPSHLTDRRAIVYQPPVFKGPGTDVIAAPLVPLAGVGPRNVAGGWFDAGDYLKFTQTASYALDDMLLAQRDTAVGGVSLDAETAHGLAWLRKMWAPSSGVLYAQVGLGTGNARLGIYGDHDLWRLPQADDAAHPAPGSLTYYASYRPVFAANVAGEPISPNLAGRVAAAFALAAQVERTSAPALARADLWRARSVLALADTEHPHPLTTVYPFNYYPETSWTDDMVLGTTEVARAVRLLRASSAGVAAAGPYLSAAEHWATRTLQGRDRDSLNLYDTSALADAELIHELRASHRTAAVPMLVADLRRQLTTAAARAEMDPFESAAVTSDYDNVSHELGLVATAALYRAVTGSREFDDFAAGQRGWVFGANAWGTSFVIGEGSRFPFCPQHQVANLVGSRTGGYAVAVGGVVNGPNGVDQFADLGVPASARACPVSGNDPFAAFDTSTSAYRDDVASWPSVEPADDFTATGILAYALIR